MHAVLQYDTQTGAPKQVKKGKKVRRPGLSFNDTITHNAMRDVKGSELIQWRTNQTKA